jgi:uncharacterized protein (DUF302 family)
MMSLFRKRLGVTPGEFRAQRNSQGGNMGDGDSGIKVLQSNSPVDQTVRKLEALLETKAVRLFAVIGLHMRPAKLLIFGDPRAGTPIMIASPSAALDLPLKILVSEDEAGLVWISYNTPEYLQARHGFPPELMRNIAAVEVLAVAAATGHA